MWGVKPRQLGVFVFTIALVLATQGCQQSAQLSDVPASFPSSPVTISIATFNIQQFTDDCTKDFDVLANICRRYDIVAIQEVKKTGAAVEKLRTQLGDNWAYELSERTGNHERFAYIYRVDRVQFLGQKGWISFDGNNPPITINRIPFYAYFKAGSFDFILVTVHLFYTDDNRRAKEIDQLIAWYKYFVAKSPEKDIIFLGDFNEKRKKPLFARFTASGTLQVVTADEEPTNLGDTERYDHVILNKLRTNEFAEEVGVFKFDETLFGNDDAKAKAAVSDHRPVNAEFRTDLPDDD